MHFILRALIDPSREDLQLLGQNFMHGIGWRHDLIGIFANDALNHSAGSGISGNNGLFLSQRIGGSLESI